ncbi:MAG TPA: adenylate kinase [Gemmatimonadaceae bacterium]|nr:adenylate kinase [Gemmatimonadaceae bacterium]
MNIVLFGKPGSGKGTQAPRLAQSLGVPTLATGDVLRAAAQAGTPLGLEAKGYMDKGALVPDAVILGIVGQALSAPAYAKGVILDGVVRTVPQAEGMRDALRALGRQVDAVVNFDVPNDEIVHRLSSRLVCAGCQTPYMTGAVGDPCPKCGGRLMRRKDDEPEAIRTRLAVFEAQTKPVFDWYRTHGTKVVTVNAVGTVDAVSARALEALR